MTMTWLSAAFASAGVFGIGSFLFKYGHHKNYPSASLLLGLYITGCITFFIMALTQGKMASEIMSLDWSILGFALLVGLGSYYGNSFLMRAYDLGPAALTSPLMSIHILLVILLSTLIYQEEITTKQCAGLVFMLSAVALLGCNLKNTTIKNRLWAIFLVLAILFIFMREGGLKMAYEAGLENLHILFFSYLFATALAIGTVLWNKKTNMVKASHDDPPVDHRRAFFLGIIIGVFSALGLSLLVYAMTHGPASIIVPIFSTRNFVALFLIVCIFREKLLRPQWISIGLLGAGVLLIS